MTASPDAPDLQVLEQRAFRVAPLLDVGAAWWALHQLRQRPDLPLDLSVRATLRLADFQRRFMPPEALATLDALGPVPEGPPPLHVELIRCHALLEQRKADEVRATLPFVPEAGGARALIQGRLHALLGELDLAQDALSSCLARDPHPELRIEALGLLARVSGRPKAMVLADLDDLDAACAACGAGLTQSLFRAWRAAEDQDLFRRMADGAVVSNLARLRALYTFGFQKDALAVAPVPLELHAALVRHGKDPAGLVRAVIALSTLTWRTGDHLRGYAIAVLGQQLGARIHGDEAMAELVALVAGYRAEAPAQEIASLDAALVEAARRKLTPGEEPQA